MNTRDQSNSLEPASDAILRVHRELLLKLGTQMLEAQRIALAGVQAEMDVTSRELSESVMAWRRRMVGLINFTNGFLIPWLLLLAVLAGATLFLGNRAGQAWNDYRAQAAREGIRAHGVLTVVRDGQLYVRVDPSSLSQGKRGNWYARAASVEFREDASSPEP